MLTIIVDTSVFQNFSRLNIGLGAAAPLTLERLAFDCSARCEETSSHKLREADAATRLPLRR